LACFLAARARRRCFSSLIFRCNPASIFMGSIFDLVAPRSTGSLAAPGQNAPNTARRFDPETDIPSSSLPPQTRRLLPFPLITASQKSSESEVEKGNAKCERSGRKGGGESPPSSILTCFSLVLVRGLNLGRQLHHNI
jgi:hypothetical protein